MLQREGRCGRERALRCSAAPPGLASYDLPGHVGEFQAAVGAGPDEVLERPVAVEPVAFPDRVDGFGDEPTLDRNTVPRLLPHGLASARAT